MLETVKEFLATDTGAIIAIATAAVTLASAIANITPNKVDDKYVGYVAKAVNWLALNLTKK
jgi:hypothetical protein